MMKMLRDSSPKTTTTTKPAMLYNIHCQLLFSQSVSQSVSHTLYILHVLFVHAGRPPRSAHPILYSLSINYLLYFWLRSRQKQAIRQFQCCSVICFAY